MINSKFKKACIFAMFTSFALWGIQSAQIGSFKQKVTPQIQRVEISSYKANTSAIGANKLIINKSLQKKKFVTIKNNAAAQNDNIGDLSDNSKLTEYYYKIAPILAVPHNSPPSEKNRLVSPEVVWSGRQFILRTRRVLRKDHANGAKQSEQPEVQEGSIVESDTVLCPSAEKIRTVAGKIDEGYFYTGSYQTVSREPVLQENNTFWLVGAKNIQADSAVEAIYKGNIIASTITKRENKYGMKIDNSFMPGEASAMFACYYGPNDFLAIGARLKYSYNNTL